MTFTPDTPLEMMTTGTPALMTDIATGAVVIIGGAIFASLIASVFVRKG